MRMPREREAYRDNLKIISEKYPDKTMLRPMEVVNVTGMCLNTVKKHFDFKSGVKGYISIADLARQMSCAK